MNNKIRGITLFELLIVLGLIALISGWAIPHLQSFFIKKQLENTAVQIQSLFQFARLNALMTHQNTYVCPSLDGNHCDSVWNKTLLVQINRQADTSSITLKAFDLPSKNVYLKLNRKLTQIRWSKRGTLQTLPVTLQICSLNRQVNFSTSVILSNTGRCRMAKIAATC